MALSAPDSNGGNAQDIAGTAASDDGDNSSLKHRDFFWDTIILYVVSVIVGLTAVDAISEYVRGSDVKCYSPDRSSISEVQDYVNARCAGSLPALEYFPAFLVIHGVLLQIPHYLWINLYSNSFSYFFSKVGEIDQSDDVLSPRTLAVLQQLENSFSTYRQNSMFFLYKAKLWLQTILAAIGLGVAAGFFYEANYVFLCPTDNDTLSFAAWPLDKQVVCAFTSLRLISSIRIGYFFLLSLAIISLIVALIWTYASHPQELGAEHVAKFVFQTSLQPHHYVPKLKNLPPFIRRRLMKHTLFATLPWLFGHKIQTDLDFLVVMLFRANSGVGQKLKQLQIERTIKELNDQENTTVSLHRGDQGKSREYLQKYGGFADESLVTAEARWRFNKQKGDESNTDTHNGVLNLLQLSSFCPLDKALVIPDTIRGSILGFAGLAPSNSGALCIQFDSPTLGLASILARAFQRVGVINFTSHFGGRDDTEFAEVVPYTGAGVVSVTCREDTLSSDKYQLEFNSKVKSIWFRSDGEAPLMTTFIVVSPITKPHHETTVNVLLEMMEAYMEECSVLVLRPGEVGGKLMSRKDFLPYVPKPTTLFKPFKQALHVDRDPSSTLEWPNCGQVLPSKVNRSHIHSTEVFCGDLGCVFEFGMYKYSSGEEEEAESADNSAAKTETALLLD